MKAVLGTLNKLISKRQKPATAPSVATSQKKSCRSCEAFSRTSRRNGSFERNLLNRYEADEGANSHFSRPKSRFDSSRSSYETHQIKISITRGGSLYGHRAKRGSCNKTYYINAAPRSWSNICR